MITVAVIGVLAKVATRNYQIYRQKALDAGEMALVRSIKMTLEAEMADYNNSPDLFAEALKAEGYPAPIAITYKNDSGWDRPALASKILGGLALDVPKDNTNAYVYVFLGFGSYNIRVAACGGNEIKLIKGITYVCSPGGGCTPQINTSKAPGATIFQSSTNQYGVLNDPAADSLCSS